MKVAPWHSANEQDRRVYHDDTSCPEGHEIADENRRVGMGDLAHCSRCKERDRRTRWFPAIR